MIPKNRDLKVKQFRRGKPYSEPDDIRERVLGRKEWRLDKRVMTTSCRTKRCGCRGGRRGGEERDKRAGVYSEGHSWRENGQ